MKHQDLLLWILMAFQTYKMQIKLNQNQTTWLWKSQKPRLETIDKSRLQVLHDLVKGKTCISLETSGNTNIWNHSRCKGSSRVGTNLDFTSWKVTTFATAKKTTNWQPALRIDAKGQVEAVELWQWRLQASQLLSSESASKIAQQNWSSRLRRTTSWSGNINNRVYIIIS